MSIFQSQNTEILAEDLKMNIWLMQIILLYCKFLIIEKSTFSKKHHF
jgi:hypothetical protein